MVSNLRTLWTRLPAMKTVHRNMSDFFSDLDRWKPPVLKVTVCGAATKMGETLSLFLTLSEFAENVALYDAKKSCCSLGVELSYLNSKVSSFNGSTLINKALEGSNIVAICFETTDGTSSLKCNKGNNFLEKAKTLQEICISCAKVCPQSIITVCNDSVNSLVPVVCEEMKKHGAFDPKKVMGITKLDVLRCSSMVAGMLKKSASEISIPVIGGTTSETMIPLLSHSKPCYPFSKDEIITITEGLRLANNEIQKCGDHTALSAAYAASSFIDSLCRALKGESKIKECCYAQSDQWLGLGYVATPALLGKDGIAELVTPDINDFEMCLLEQCRPYLKDDINKGLAFARGSPETALLTD